MRIIRFIIAFVICFVLCDAIVFNMNIGISNPIDEELPTTGCTSHPVSREMEAYRKVLLNQKEFFCTSSKENIYWKDYLIDGLSLEYAIVDMDGDGITEVVLNYIGPNIRTVLRYEGDVVFGYAFGIKGLGEIKTDGSFDFGYATHFGVGRLKFSGSDYESVFLALYDGTSNNEDKLFLVNGVEVEEDVFYAFVESHHSKYAIEWRELKDSSLAPSYSIESSKAEDEAYPIDYYNRNDRYENTRFVDNEFFAIINNAYRKIDFSSEFEKGDEKVYDFYKIQYLKLLNGEATFFDRQTQNEFYIDEFKEMDFTHPSALNLSCNGSVSTYDVRNYAYYFFDMDGDGSPELGVSGGRFIYFIKYIPDTQTFILWHEIFTANIRPLSTRKLVYQTGSSPMHYAYSTLDKNGDEECSVRFYIEWYHDNEQQESVLYMVSLPQFADKSKNIEITSNMKNQSVFEKYQNTYYFKVTEEQWHELTEEFFVSQSLFRNKLDKVRFTYEELFCDY